MSDFSKNSLMGDNKLSLTNFYISEKNELNQINNKNEENINDSENTKKETSEIFESVENLKNIEKKNDDEEKENIILNSENKNELTNIENNKFENTTNNSVENISSQETIELENDRENLSKIDNNDPSSSKNIENKEEVKSIGDYKNESEKIKEETIEDLKIIEKEIIQEKESGNVDKSAEFMSTAQKTHELISQLSEKISKGFDSLGMKMSSNKDNQEKTETSQNNTNIINNSQNHVHSKNKGETNYSEEYRKSLRSNMPLDSFMGMAVKLKGNNIAQYA